VLPVDDFASRTSDRDSLAKLEPTLNGPLFLSMSSISPLYQMPTIVIGGTTMGS
jgi:hypothetical protein